MVGGVKSPAPVVNVSVAGDKRSFPATSWISLASGVNVIVYVRSAGNAEFIANEKDISAASGEKPHEFAPGATTTGSLVAGLLSVKVISLLSKLSPVQYTGSERLIVSVVLPTLAFADVTSGRVVSGAVAMVVRVCGATVLCPRSSWIARPPVVFKVTVTSAPIGAATMSCRFAEVMPLSPSALQNGTLSPTI